MTSINPTNLASEAVESADIPDGQRPSKHARARRRKAAKKAAWKAAEEGDSNDTNDEANQKQGAGEYQASNPHQSWAKQPPSPVEVVEQKLDNLFEMIRQEREGVFTGPQMTIYAGSTAVGGIYKRAAMALSPVLNQHFRRNPAASEFRFAEGEVSPDAIRYLFITWMYETCQGFEIYAVPMQDNFADDVALLCASRLLGLGRYTQQISTAYIKYLKTKLPAYEEIEIIEQNTTSEKDILWAAMVNRLCYSRLNKLMPDPDDFEAFLKDHPRLARAMESSDAYYAGAPRNKQRAASRAKLQTNEDAEGSQQENHEAE